MRDPEADCSDLLDFCKIFFLFEFISRSAAKCMWQKSNFNTFEK